LNYGFDQLLTNMVIVVKFFVLVHVTGDFEQKKKNLFLSMF